MFLTSHCFPTHMALFFFALMAFSVRLREACVAPKEMKIRERAESINNLGQQQLLGLGAP